MSGERPSSAWKVFLTAHAVVLDAIGKRLADAELPPLEWYDALWALEQAPGQRLRMSEFEQWMVISRSNVTRLVDRLETAGLVRRERSVDDRRGSFAVLTTAGRAQRRRMWPVYQSAIEALFEAPLSATELASVERICRKVLAQHRRQAPE